METAINKRLSALEKLAEEAKKANGKLYIGITDSMVKIIDTNRKTTEYEADIPIEAVEEVEAAILKRIPEHVVVSYSFGNLIDLFLEWKECFDEFSPILSSGIVHGNFYEAMEGFTLRHLLLLSHVQMQGCPTASNREKGICGYTDEFIRSIAHSVPYLLTALRDIETKEKHYRENCMDDPYYEITVRKY